MTRTVAREIAIQILFALSQNDEQADDAIAAFFEGEHYATLAEENDLYKAWPGKKQKEYISAVVNGVQEHRLELDEKIEKYAKGWKLERISHIAATIIRAAMFEVLYMPDIPNSVAINEAVELSKGYEEPETVSFINGILGSFMRAELGEAVDETAHEQEAEELPAEQAAPQGD